VAKRLTLAALLSVIASMLVFVQPALAATGLRISGTRVVEANGSTFVMRGVNHPHVWYTNQTSSFANIKSFGANTVRVVLGTGKRWGPSMASDVANVISLCKQSRLICVLEVHDTTGYGDEGAAASLDEAASYWTGIASVLKGQEDYVAINLGNEPLGNNQQVNANWATLTSNAVSRLRGAGLHHLVVVDGPNWGQDWQNIMRSDAASVLNADPDRNILFSIHMYGVYDTAAKVTDYFDAFRSAGLPLVVGEFGDVLSGVATDTIMEQAQARGLGYIGWSWSGNASDGAHLDMTVGFDPTKLSSWGDRFLNGPNGVRQTSREATIYGGGGGGDTQPPSTPGTPTVSGVTATSVTLNWAASTDNVGVAGYEVYRATGGTFTLVGSPSTTTFTDTGLTASTTYRYYLRARDAVPNFSANSGTAVVTTPSGGGNAPCKVTYSASNWDGGGGFTAGVTITNTGTSTVNGWTLAFTYLAGQRISPPGWSATWAQPAGSPSVTATNLDYNATLTPNASTSIGFNGTYSGANPTPTSFTLNGTACTTS
jgi:mannan endo-1,4-beta-mannosidase